MSKIKLMTDSGSDISLDVAKENNITVIPFKYTFDGENYIQSLVDKTYEEFFEILRNTENIPKTTQITPIEYEEAYRQVIKEGYDTIIVVCLSSRASGTFQNANIAANAVMDDENCDITIIDSQTFSSFYGTAVIKGAKAANEGKSKEEIIEIIEKELNRYDVIFIVESLEHLKKGGRINAASLLVANMLDIKPILTVKDGLIEQRNKIRGNKRIYKKMVDIITDEGNNLNNKKVRIVHSCIPQRAEEAKQAILEAYPDAQIEFSEIGEIIGCHAGPDVIGIGYSKY